MLYEKKTGRKFRFVDDFDEYEEMRIQARARHFSSGNLSEPEPEFPKLVETKFFGKRYLRQIAKVDWRECRVIRMRTVPQPDGSTRKKEETITLYEEVMGDRGGWLESEACLSQSGDCWVEADGYVVGAARVSGDAVVKGGAEVGDDAKVSGKVVLSGPVGVGGTAQVGGSAEISGGRRLAVFGNAVVMGKSKVLDEARVYGNASLWYVGDQYWNGRVSRFYNNLTFTPAYYSVVKGRARVFGNAVVSGTVSDDSLVYGQCEVRGVVCDTAEVGGDAYIDFTGKVAGEVRVLTGSVSGEVRGEGYAAYTEFSVGAGSVVELRKEGEMSEAEARDVAWRKQSDEDKDKTEDMESVSYAGKIRSLSVGRNCNVTESDLEGDVSLSYASVAASQLKNCRIGPDSFWGGSFIDKCVVEDSRLAYVRAVGSTLKGVYAASELPVNISDSKLDGCTFLGPCIHMGGCALKGVTVATISMESETVQDCYVCEGSYHSSHLPAWKRWRTLFTDREKPAQKDHFKYLKGFYEYVFKFKDREAYRKAQRYEARVGDEIVGGAYSSSAIAQAFWPFYARGLSRWGWLFSYYEWAVKFQSKYGIADESEDSEESEDSDESDDEEQTVEVETMRSVYLIGLYLSALLRMPVFRITDLSWESVKAAVEKTIASFNEGRFTAYYDFGALKDDPDIVELEEKYYVSFNPTIDIGNAGVSGMKWITSIYNSFTKG